MAIVSASIEANGYVLALVVSGTNSAASGLSYDSDYPLTPDGTPKLTLTSTHPGYDVSGGIAVANATKARSFIATRPIRKASIVTNAGVISAKLPDETVASGGQFTVRIALSNWVYATDTALTLNVLAGWRTGEVGATVSVTNGSTVNCPAPIHRWVDVPYRLQRGAFDVEMLVFGFAPQGTQPVAAVKFTVTDGTTIKSYWTTALSTSTQFGDKLRCHRVTVDPSVATALTAGLLRIDAEVYPWIGAMRPTDTAGTKSMTNLATSSASYGAGDAVLGQAQAPFAVAWDPTGARYPYKCVYVDFVNGTATASVAMIGSGTSDATALAAAKAIAPAARAKDAATAVEALRLANFSFPAANGQVASSGYVIDGCRVVLASGVHANCLGGGAVAYSPQAVETWLRIEGDPADANPRQNVILRTNTTVSPGFNSFVQRVSFSNMSIELGFDLLDYTRYQWYDNVEFRGQTGQTLSSHPPTGGSIPPATYLGLFFTNTRVWRTGVSITVWGGSARARLIRHCEYSRNAEAPVLVTSRIIGEIEDGSDFRYGGVNGTSTNEGVPQAGPISNFNDPLSVYDSIVAYNDQRSSKGRTWNGGIVLATYSGKAINQCYRQVIFCNISERIGNSLDAQMSTGEQQQSDTFEVIFEANTTVNGRINWGYNDSQASGAGTTAGVAATDAQQQCSYVNVRMAANYISLTAVKHDNFSDPGVMGQRQAAGDPRAHGIRPYNINCWASLYGVGLRDNAGFFEAKTAINNLPLALSREYDGLNSSFYTVVSPPGDPHFTNDQSAWRLGVDYGATAVGGGDYTPLAGATANGRVTSGNSDVDFFGNVRA